MATGFSIDLTNLLHFLALVVGSGVSSALLTVFVSSMKERRLDDEKRYYTAVRIAITLEDYGKLLDRFAKQYPVGFPLEEKPERRVYPNFEGYESGLDWRLVKREVLDGVIRFPGTSAHWGAFYQGMIESSYYYDGESAVAVAKLARDAALKLARQVRIVHQLSERKWDDQPWMFTKDQVPTD